MRSSAIGRTGTTQPGKVLGDRDEGIQLFALLGKGALHEAVLGRVGDRREQPPVELDRARLLVVLVLVAAALGDLDQDRDRVTG